MFTKDFNLEFPSGQVAQSLAEPRDSSKLMILDRQTGELVHSRFDQITSEFQSGDVLVLNDSKVFKARLYGAARNREFEVQFIRPTSSDEKSSVWKTLIHPAKQLQVNDPISFYGMSGSVQEKVGDGVILLAFDIPASEVMEFLDEKGEVPLPAYIDASEKANSQYQTLYAKESGSAAAPDAGFHFTEALLEKLKGQGVHIEYVTLHIGLGTFAAAQIDPTQFNDMYPERVIISSEVSERLNTAKSEGRRVVVVGASVARALEGVAKKGRLPKEFDGDVRLLLKSGYAFQIIDGLITHFHLPLSTSLTLAHAFSGIEHVGNAYETAVKERYRGLCFGDVLFMR